MGFDSEERVNPRRASAPTPPVAGLLSKDRWTPGAAPTLEEALVLPNTDARGGEKKTAPLSRDSRSASLDRSRRASDPLPPTSASRFERYSSSAAPTLEQAIVIPSGSKIVQVAGSSLKEGSGNGHTEPHFIIVKEDKVSVSVLDELCWLVWRALECSRPFRCMSPGSLERPALRILLLSRFSKFKLRPLVLHEAPHPIPVSFRCVSCVPRRFDALKKGWEWSHDTPNGCPSERARRGRGEDEGRG